MDTRTPSAVTPEDREAALRALTERLLTQPMPPDGRMVTPQVMLGQVPAEWPVDIPMPEGARVAGSLVRPQQITVILDTALGPAQVTDYYTAWARTAGWTTPEPFDLGGGFMPTGFSQLIGATFCRGTRGPALRVQTYPQVGADTDVRLTLDSNPQHTPCAPSRRSLSHMMLTDVIPPLLPPAGSQQWPEGGGGSPDRVHSDARLETTLTLAAVTAHYEAQLDKAGWHRQAGDQIDPTAWSSWTFADADGAAWQAFFFLLHRPDRPQEYILGIRAVTENAAAPDTDGGVVTWDVVKPH